MCFNTVVNAVKMSIASKRKTRAQATYLSMVTD